MFLQKTKKIIVLLVISLISLSKESFTQTDVEEPTVRISTELVQFDVVVQDSKGNIVKNLKAEDFEVYEDKERQEINTFSFIDLQASKDSQSNQKTSKDSSTTPSPETVNKNLQSNKKAQIGRTIAIVVDELALPLDTIETVKTTLKKFVDTQMLPTDLVAVVKTGKSIGGLQQFTSNKQLLYAAIQDIKGNLSNLNRSDVDSVPTLQGIDKLSSSNNALVSFQASTTAIKFVIEALKELPGRKSLLLLSAQFPGEELAESFEATEELNSLIETANRASVVCYTSDVRSAKFLGVTAQDDLDIISAPTTTQNEEAAQFLIDTKPEVVKLAQRGLRVLASSTGGTFVLGTEAGVKTTLNSQQGYYLIGYSPKKEIFNTKDVYHKLSVKVKKSGLVVKTRKGFYAIEDKELNKTTPEEEILKAAISPFNTSQLNVQLTPTFTYDKTEGNLLHSIVYLNSTNLSFSGEEEKKLSLETLIYLFDQRGNLVNQVSQKNNITIPIEAYVDLLRNGFAFSLKTPVKEAGAYQLRLVVRDINSKSLGTAGQIVFVPDVKGTFSLSGLTLIDENNAKPQASTSQQTLLALAKRKFNPGSVLQYSYHIYKPALDPKTKQPNLKIQTTFYKDNKKVSANSGSLEIKDQKNLEDILVNNKLSLKDLKPGKYIFQVVVTDQANKKRTQIQEIDFEISE
ncbi:MAG: VWA domain-containing protein [Acidobacteria bacterium]|nr:VWA domain-containing protein [Acidobacteriota bacterium]